MNIGLIGAGNISQTHARAAVAIPGVAVVAVHGANAAKARELAAAHRAAAYDELGAFLAHEPMDMVIIGSPSGVHAEQGVAAARRRLHVLVEKPIDVTTERADELIAAAEHAGVRLGVLFQDRLKPGIVRLKQLVESGGLGRVLSVSARVPWYRPPDYYRLSRWRGTAALDGGGALMNQGVHYVDLLQWVMGPVERVFARCRTSAHEAIEVEDIAVAVLSFANGAVGILESSTAVYPGLSERLEVTGTGGTAIVEAGALKVRELKDEKGETSPYGGKAQPSGDGSAGSAAAANPADISYLGHREQLRDVLNAIESGGKPAIDGAEARKALEIILAVYESARSGRDVELPLAVRRA